MIVTREYQEAMVNNYRNEGHTEDECMGYTEGLTAMLDLVCVN